MKKKILITGSNGFIGKNLNKSLRSRFNIIPVHKKDIIKKKSFNFQRYICCHSLWRIGTY